MKTIALREIAGRIPVVRSTLHSVPKYHVGSPTENRLGLQVLRVLSKRITRSLRSRSGSTDIDPYVRVLEKDGVIVLPNFLEPNLFRSIVDEFEAAKADVAMAPYQGLENGKLYRKQLRVSDSPGRFPLIRSTFQDSTLLRRIVSSIIRRSVTVAPEVLLDTYQCMNPDGADNDIENILHADLHVPTIKMFFYLSKTDQSNGALVYAKGSQKLTWARLLHEYDMSVRQAKLNRGLTVESELLERRSSLVRNIIRPEYRRRMKIVESPICVEANTLVIVNNMGFHRRGEFNSERPRKALLINYRNAEPTVW